MTFAQAVFLAFLQGISELFPVSSLGHTVLVPALLHWKFDRSDPTFVAFLVVLHLGTAIALIVFYWSTWGRVVAAFFASIARGKLGTGRDERIAWLLIVGTIPAGLLGLFFKTQITKLFGSTLLVAIFLVANAAIMFLGEALRRRAAARGEECRPLQTVGWKGALGVGFAQALALFPGISRSGSSIVAGLLLDLTHEDAAHYSFLLATPIIFAAATLAIPELLAPGVHLTLLESVVGAVVAGATAYASLVFLTRYFRRNDLRPFGWYCLIFGAACLLLLRIGVIA